MMESHTVLCDTRRQSPHFYSHQKTLVKITPSPMSGAVGYRSVAPFPLLDEALSPFAVAAVWW
jgi:hypothetical protein